MVSENWKIQLPGAPDPTYVVVRNIDESVSEDEARKLFAFCGDIVEFDLQQENKDSKRALVKFRKLEEAKTALLLSGTEVHHREVFVQYLFPEFQEASHDTPPNYEQASRAVDTNYEGKPALYVAHELLAAGHLLGEQVLSRASRFDAKYRVTGRTQEQARSLDNQYKFSNYLQQWDDRFNISSRAKTAYDKVQSSSLGRKAIFTVNDAYQSALSLSRNAREIAERKRASGEKLFGKIPLPPAPSSMSRSSTSTGQAYVASPSGPSRSATGSSGPNNDYRSSPVAPNQPPTQYPNEKQ
ncbi:Protein vip1 [Coemansia sp. RSA 1290]|nr:Protein vip1 [Coemansia sp. RSA 1290]KAJ2652344.1 Protein vip1 [Coemansia sp. RSA 1250]